MWKSRRLSRSLSSSHFYNLASGRLSFGGEEGDKLVRDAMNTAQSDLDEADDTLPPDYAAKDAPLVHRIGRSTEIAFEIRSSQTHANRLRIKRG